MKMKSRRDAAGSGGPGTCSGPADHPTSRRRSTGPDRRSGHRHPVRRRSPPRACRNRPASPGGRTRSRPRSRAPRSRTTAAGGSRGSSRRLGSASISPEERALSAARMFADVARRVRALGDLSPRFLRRRRRWRRRPLGQRLGRIGARGGGAGGEKQGRDDQERPAWLIRIAPVVCRCHARVHVERDEGGGEVVVRLPEAEFAGAVGRRDGGNGGVAVDARGLRPTSPRPRWRPPLRRRRSPGSKVASPASSQSAS